MVYIFNNLGVFVMLENNNKSTADKIKGQTTGAENEESKSKILWFRLEAVRK